MARRTLKADSGGKTALAAGDSPAAQPRAACATRDRRLAEAARCGWRNLRATLGLAASRKRRTALSIPNQITLGRLALTCGFFVLLSLYSPQHADRERWMLATAFWVFLLAALSDAVDGWLARTWGQVTSFGRVVDPVVDKVMICGAFVFFASSKFQDPASGGNLTGVAPWMAVLILLRELLVSAMRAFSEAHGERFAANWAGKIKMFVQSLTVCFVLGVQVWPRPTLARISLALVWLTVVVTLLSIGTYLQQARAFMFTRTALGDFSARAPAGPARQIEDPAAHAGSRSAGPVPGARV